MGHPVILLFGMPRSGTTWIGKIFDSHPDTLYRHEPDSWGSLNAVPLLPGAIDVERYQGVVTEFAERLPTVRQTKVSASLPIFKKSYYSHAQLAIRRLAVWAAKVAARIKGEAAVFDPVNYRRVPQLRIVWKSIESVGRLGLFARILAPNPAVLILRHPCGYVASVLRGEARGKFEGGIATSEDYGMFELLVDLPQAKAHGLTLATLKALSPLERLAWRWALFNEKAMDDIGGLGNATLVRYEDFCSDPVATTQRIFAFCGLRWNPQTEAFLGASTSQENTAYYSIFKNPEKAANKWRQELSPEQIEQVKAVVTQTRAGRLYFAD